MKTSEVRATTINVETINVFAQSWLLSTEQAEELLFDLNHFRNWLKARALNRK